MSAQPVIPWTQGYLAQRQGKPDTANRYPAATVEWLAWRKGWKAARDTHGEAKPSVA